MMRPDAQVLGDRRLYHGREVAAVSGTLSNTSKGVVVHPRPGTDAVRPSGCFTIR
jgi:hypothetical protein